MAKLYEESQTPEWMKPLKKLHQRRKSEQLEKEQAERRKAEEERQRFEAMPAWKKQLIYKKRAKSAESLVGPDTKNLVKSETKELETANLDCKVKEGTVENEPDPASNEVGHDNDNGISDHEKCDDDSEEVETSLDKTEKDGKHDKVNGKVEDTGVDGELTIDSAAGNEGEEIEIAEKIDGDSEQKLGKSDEDENHGEELADESSHNSSENDVNPAIPGDKIEEIDEHDENVEQSETAEEQVKESSKLAEENNSNEDNTE